MTWFCQRCVSSQRMRRLRSSWCTVRLEGRRHTGSHADDSICLIGCCLERSGEPEPPADARVSPDCPPARAQAFAEASECYLERSSTLEPAADARGSPDCPRARAQAFAEASECYLERSSTLELPQTQGVARLPQRARAGLCGGIGAAGRVLGGARAQPGEC